MFSKHTLFFLCVLYVLTGNAQIFRNEVIATGDAWFWDFKNQNRNYKPAFVKGKYYLPVRDNEIIESDGTTAGSKILTCLSGKGELYDMAATDNYLYIIMKGPAANNAYINYFMYRIAPGKDEAVQIKSEYSSANYGFSVTKNSWILHKFQPAGNKLILYSSDDFLKGLTVFHDDDINPMAHRLEVTAIKNYGALSFLNFTEPLAVAGESIYVYKNDTSIVEKRFEKAPSSDPNKYYVDKNYFDLPKAKAAFVSLADINQQNAYAIIEQTNNGNKTRAVYSIINTKMKNLATVDGKVSKLIGDNGNLYAYSANTLYKINTQTGQKETLIQGDKEFGYLDLYQNHFWFRGNHIFYSNITDRYVPDAEYFVLDAMSGKHYPLFSTSLGVKNKEDASTKRLLHILGDYVFTISRERAFCALDAENIFDKKQKMEIPLPDYYGTPLSKGESDIYGNFILVKDKIFYYAGYFEYKRKDGKKKAKVHERVMGCISLK